MRQGRQEPHVHDCLAHKRPSGSLCLDSPVQGPQTSRKLSEGYDIRMTSFYAHHGPGKLSSRSLATGRHINPVQGRDIIPPSRTSAWPIIHEDAREHR